MSVSDPKKGIIFNSVSVFLNAIVPLFSKWAMQSFKPLEVAFLICLLNVVFCYCWGLKKPLFDKPVALKSYLKIAAVNSVGIISLYTSLSYLDPVTFGFIGRFYVIFTTLISALVLKEGSSPKEILSIVVGVCGTFFLADKGAANWASVIGVGFALLFTLSFAIANFQIKSASPALNPVGVLLFNNVFASVVLAAFILPDLKGHQEILINYHHVASIVAASLFSFVSLSLLFASYRHLSFRLTSLIRATNPLVSAVVAIPFFPVTLSRGNWFGAFLLFVSIVVLGIHERRG